MNTPSNIWIVLCSIFALTMTAPGLALYYGGLVRRKNVLSVQIQCLYLMGLIGFCWGMWGYSLACSDGNRWIGNLTRAGMRGMHPENGVMSDSIQDELGKFMFYGSVAVFSGTLICGAFAERLKFTALTLFMTLWMTVIFCPLCYWVWGNGFLNGDHAILGGATDFAGATVIHLSAGVSALVSAMIVGQRLGYLMDDMRPHNLTYTVVGASVLWIGSLFLHAGHAADNSPQLLNAVLFTSLTIAAGAVTWPAIDWLQRGKASALGAASGVVAGLACASSACGFVAPCWAPLFGILATLGGYASCKALGTIKIYDDSLDVFGLHAVAAIIGLLMTALLASPDLVPEKTGTLFGGGIGILAGQLLAIAIVVIWVGLTSTVLFKLVDIVVGLRVSQENEMLGLDVAQHGQEGYILNK